MSNSQERVLKEHFEKIFKRASSELAKKGINGLVIRIDPKKYSKINRDRCIDEIVRACVENVGKIGKHRTEIAINPIPELAKITAFENDEEMNIITFDSRGAIFGPLREKTLKEIIEKKTILLNNSKGKYPNDYSGITEYWLLMTIEGTFYSNFAGIQKSEVTLGIECCFEKIHVFHERENWAKEIRTVFKSG